MTGPPRLVALLAGALLIAGGAPALSATPGAAGAAAAPAGTDAMVTVLVTLRDRADLSSVHGNPTKRLRTTINVLHATASTSQGPLLARLRTAMRSGDVSDVTPLWVVNALSVTATPDVVTELARRADVRAVTPDGLSLVPAAAAATPNQSAIGAPALWDLGRTGEGVVVASLDSGVDVTHPDLMGRWRGGTNSWFDPYGQHALPTDLTGHGTGVTGLMVGGDASGSSIGTAPGATWIAARVFDDSGASSATAVHQAFQWVLDPDHDPATADAPQVVNGSWSVGSGPGCDLTFRPDVSALRAAGILPVFAAGNFGPGLSSSVSPANYPESLSVGAVSSSSLVYSASGRGPSACGGRTRTFPDVVAPGVGVTTTDRYGLYQSFSGTSAAAPHAAGVLALLLSGARDLTPDQQQQALTGTAHDLGPLGPDEAYGAGLLDALAAWRSLPPPSPTPDFLLSVAPATVAVTAGHTAHFDLTVTAREGFGGDVSFSLSGTGPGDGTWAFSPVMITGNGTTGLTLDTASTAAPGSRLLTMSATSGTLTRTVGVTLEITSVPDPPLPPTPTAPTSPAATPSTSAPPTPPTSLPPSPPSATADPLYFSTRGAANPPHVTGAADDADLLHWNGADHTRVWDAGSARVPGSADVDGLTRVDDTHAYLSFSGRVVLPRRGRDLVVEDEDVLRVSGSTWSLWFDGSKQGLARGADLVGAAVHSGRLYFALHGGNPPPGLDRPGAGGDSDIYRWNGPSARRPYTRVFDASAHDLPATAVVDGVDADNGSLYLSFSTPRISLPGLGGGGVQDEDVVSYADGRWSLYFDGTAHGLVSPDLDVDAFDVSRRTPGLGRSVDSEGIVTLSGKP